MDFVAHLDGIVPASNLLMMLKITVSLENIMRKLLEEVRFVILPMMVYSEELWL